MRAALKLVLATQALISGMTAVVLLASPAVIPASFGLLVTPDAYLICYLLGAAELSLAVLSVVALRDGDLRAVRAASLYFLAFHISSATVDGYALAQGVSSKVVGNLVPHLVVAALVGYFGLHRNGMNMALPLAQGTTHAKA